MLYGSRCIGWMEVEKEVIVCVGFLPSLLLPSLLPLFLSPFFLSFLTFATETYVLSPFLSKEFSPVQKLFSFSPY